MVNSISVTGDSTATYHNSVISNTQSNEDAFSVFLTGFNFVLLKGKKILFHTLRMQILPKSLLNFAIFQRKSEPRRPSGFQGKSVVSDYDQGDHCIWNCL